ncbi:MAG: DUF4327 family protein [Cyanobacteria bacterium P01_A01_bin.123]
MLKASAPLAQIDLPRYSIEIIKGEACQLVQSRTLGRQQRIYALCEFIPSREWSAVELELERHGYLLRDRIVDLLCNEDWCDD